MGEHEYTILMRGLRAWAEQCQHQENIDLLNRSADKIRYLQHKMTSQARLLCQYEKICERFQNQYVEAQARIRALENERMFHGEAGISREERNLPRSLEG